MAAGTVIWRTYLVALAAVAVATGVRWSLDPWLGGGAVTIYLFGAIVVAVWYGGYRPGVLAAIAGYVAANYLFLGERGTVGFSTSQDFLRFAGFAGSASLIIALGGAMHAARRRAEASAARSDSE